MHNPEAEWFGFTRVGAAEKTQRVGSVFRRVAARYDLMNDLMSLGVHRLWKAAFVRALRPQPGQRLLDVAAGTGDIAAAWTQRAGATAQAILCDPSSDMLAAAVRKGAARREDCVVADAAALPFADASFDTVTISFGLRNVTKMDDALAEFFRVLKPGGKFFCLEFAPVETPLLRNLYDAYSFNVLPRLGGLVAGDREAYQYLAESIRQFPAPPALAERMAKAGFCCVQHRAFSGGICVLHEGLRA